MNLKNHSWQLSNLELSKKLKELDVKQESLWWWIQNKNGKWIVTTTGHKDALVLLARGKQVCYSAFTVAELGEMLPRSFAHLLSTMSLMSIKRESGWEVIYRDENEDIIETLYSKTANTEANARAKMLICLIENKLWTK